jgi:hypothetical protein
LNPPNKYDRNGQYIKICNHVILAKKLQFVHCFLKFFYIIPCFLLTRGHRKPKYSEIYGKTTGKPGGLNHFTKLGKAGNSIYYIKFDAVPTIHQRRQKNRPLVPVPGIDAGHNSVPCLVFRFLNAFWLALAYCITPIKYKNRPLS